MKIANRGEAAAKVSRDAPNDQNTSTVLTLDGAQSQVPLLVLSRDTALLDSVRRAAPRGMLVMHSPDLDQVAETLSSIKPGVLLADTADTPDLASMLAQLTQHFPELVCVVAGKVADKGTLMQLTAAGGIFRFLLKPLTHGQTRLALEAAHAQNLELKAKAERLGSVRRADRSTNYLTAYAKLAAALIVIVGGIWWAATQFTAEQNPTTPVNVPEPSTLPAEKPDPLQAELRLAKEAFDQGLYVEHAGESALDLYRSALALDPSSEPARAGVRSVADKILERAETALTNGQLEAAVRNIESARDIDATHPRLAFLDVQIAREHERLKLSRAHDITERVSKLVAQAYDRMRGGNLFTPPGNSARDALIAARRLDPTDPTVTQATRDLSANLIEAAQRFVTAGNTASAKQHIDVAREIGATGPSLAAVERSLASAMRRDAPPLANTSASDAAVAKSSSESASGSAAPNAKLTPVSTEQAASSAKVSTAQSAGAAPDLPASQPTTTLLQAAALRRTRQVAPKYPDRAAMNGTQGWVDIEFTISPEGVPVDLKVRDASPKRMFDRAALDALAQWRFEPLKTANGPHAQRAILRMRFELEN
jgi:TonB family protein